MIVYGDLYFLLNGLADGVLLYAAGKAARETVRPWRLTTAAAFGAAYAVGELWLGGTALYGAVAKVAASVAMVLMAYGIGSIPRCLRLCAYLYAGALFLAGATLTFNFLGTSAWRPQWGIVPWWSLALALALLAGIGAFAWVRRRAAIGEAWLLPLAVWLGEGCARCMALVDTGNLLTDPLGDGPVLVADPAALASAIPPRVASALGSGDAARAAAAVDGTPWSSRLRVVPFRGVGQDAGVLLGLRADRVQVGGIQAQGVTVAVAGRCLDPRGRYQALVPASLLAGADGPGTRAS